jgi:hypothetical protein
MVNGFVVAMAVFSFLALSSLAGVAWLWRQVGQVRRASRALSQGGLHGLDQVLREQELRVRQVYDRTVDLERRMDLTEQRLAGALQRVKVLRFNPFRDTGGDQSFVIALLDDAGSGIVVTGLHSRAETRVYAKQISARNSEYPLSDEEIAAIRAAAGPEAGNGSR